MAKKTIKFKGIEFEECSNKEYEDRANTYAWIRIKGKFYGFMPKGKKCSKCGQAVRE